MKYNYIVLVVLLLLGVVVKAQVNPYPDGTSLADGTTIIGSPWSVAAGTTISGEGEIISGGNGTISGTFNVAGDFTIPNNGASLSIASGGRLEIFGNLYANSSFTVAEGAVLIVHGNFISAGSAASNLSGNVIVSGYIEFSGVTLSSTGKLVVGGDVTIYNAGGSYSGDIYALNPDAVIDVPDGIGLIETEDVGDLTEFLNNESGNSDLMEAARDAGVISDVDAPTGFTFTSLSGTDVDLQWLLNANSDSVMITWTETDLNDLPVDGTNYEVGETLDAGSEVIYKGNLEAWTFTGLTPGVTAYLRIWSYTNPDNEFSIPVKLEVKALSSETIFYDGFESGGEAEWTIDAPTGNNSWVIGTAESYMGDNAIYISNDGGSTSTYKKVNASTVTMTLSLSGIPAKYKSIELSFYWKCMAEENADAGFVNGVDWSEQYAGQSTWVEKVIDITDLISGGSVSIPFSFVTNNAGGVDPGFCIDEVRVVGSEVAKPEAFSGVANSTTEVALEWTKSINNDNVIIAYSPYGSVGRPESGKNYEAGDYLSGGGQVVYVGAATSTTHSGTFQGKLSYNIWSVTGGEYSSALTTEVNIPVELPYDEDFETDVDEWKFGVGYNSWYNGSAEANSGSKSAYISYDRGFTAGFDVGSASSAFMDVTVDLRGYETADLSFYWKADGSTSQFGEVYLNDTKLTSTEGTSSFHDSDWNEEIFSLDSYTGGVHTIRFRWSNNKGGTAQIPGFCIDDISISGTIAAPASFTATNPNDLLNNLSWVQNAYDDEVLVAWSADGTFGDPEVGVSYEAGDAIPGGGTVLYLGDLLSYEHAPLNYGAVYYYKAWSHRNGIYSTGIEKNANTPAKVSVFEEDWEDNADGYPEWTITTISSKHWGPNNWLKGGTDVAASGSRSSYIRDNNSEIAAYRPDSYECTSQLTVDVDLSDLNKAFLYFDWMCLGDGDNAYGEVYVDNVKVSEDKEYKGTEMWESTVIDISGYVGSSVTIEFRWYNASTSWADTRLGFCIDNIELGGIYDPTSTVTNGQTIATSIASIQNEQADAVSVFSFDLTDLTSQYNDITRVQQLVVSKGSLNAIDNWSDAIAGALLFGPDMPASGMAGVVTSGAITFTGTDMILLESQDVAETYSLSIWLKTDLNASDIEDGDAFAFAVSGEDIVTGLGDDFIKANLVESGAVAIEVTATELLFTQQPSAYGTMGYALATSPEVSAVDVNGNIDVDFTGDITLSNSGALTMTPLTATASSGTASFTDLTIGSIGGGSTIVTLDASYTGLISPTSDEIQLDSYCIPAFADNDAYIQQVMINTIDNTTGQDASPYVQYLDLETSLLIGTNYDITIAVYNTTDSKGKAVTRFLNVWIDWDSDGEFDEVIAIDNTNTKDDFVVMNGTITIPADAGAVVGAHRMRIQFTDDDTDACSGSSGEAEDYTVVLATEGWLGQNNLWNLATNWSSGAVPGITTDVYIPETPYLGSAYPIIDGVADMRNLEIASNASLTVQAGSLVTINGDITLNGDLVIENTNASPASVITNTAASITGDVTVRWTYDELHWWFTGHSISNPTIATYQGILTDLSNPDNKYALYDYTDVGSLVNLASTGTEFNQDVASGERIRGYQLKVLKPSTVVEHVGTLNNQASYSKSAQDGWQIIANPYPAFYQLQADPGMTGDFAATEGTVYVSDSDTNADKDFLTYDVFNDVFVPASFDGMIAPGQAFYIKTATGEVGNPIVMDANNRDNAGTTPSLKSAKSDTRKLLRLYLSNQHNLSNEAVILLQPQAEYGFTRKDSEKRMYSGTNYSYIYSIVDDTKAVINVLPDELKDYQQILGVQTKKGEQQLRISGIDALSVDYHIVLEDKQTGVLTTLTDEFVYVFTAEEGIDHERFVLHFKASKIEVPTDIDDIHSNEGAEVSVYVQNESSLKVSCEWDIEEKTVAVYTVSGSLVMNDEFSGEVYEAELDVQPGIYIVKLSGNNHQYQEKVLIK